MSLYNIIHTKIVPPLFLLIFTALGQILALYGRDETITLEAVVKYSVGNGFAWSILTVFILWAFLSLKIPSKKCSGQALPSGFVPQFQANGIIYFWTTVSLFGVLFLSRPNYAIEIYQNVPQIFGASNIIGLILCIWLLIKGKWFPEEHPDDGASTKGNIIFDFYRGVELHPTIFGVSVKQLVICRYALMGWLLLTLIYFVAATQIHGFNYPFFVSTLIQLIYTLKFFLYESTGYFDSLDIAYDRSGFYIVWGCTVWFPAFYGLHAYYYVHNPPQTSPFFALFYLILGISAVILGYRADYEKYLVRKTNSPNIMMYGKLAETIPAEYTDSTGKLQKSRLLVSGCWGLARHFNYVFEVITYITLTTPGLGSGIIPYLLPTFMIILLGHRSFRDEEKCKKKYGKYWDLYCSRVPYRFIPWVY